MKCQVLNLIMFLFDKANKAIPKAEKPNKLIII